MRRMESSTKSTVSSPERVSFTAVFVCQYSRTGNVTVSMSLKYTQCLHLKGSHHGHLHLHVHAAHLATLAPLATPATLSTTPASHLAAHSAHSATRPSWQHPRFPFVLSASLVFTSRRLFARCRRSFAAKLNLFLATCVRSNNI